MTDIDEKEYAVHKRHCFRIVQPENVFMGCKYGPDEDCPVKPQADTNSKSEQVSITELTKLVQKHRDIGYNAAAQLVDAFVITHPLHHQQLEAKIAEARVDEEKIVYNAYLNEVRHGTLEPISSEMLKWFDNRFAHLTSNSKKEQTK